jgi:hypothetical protein
MSGGRRGSAPTQLAALYPTSGWAILRDRWPAAPHADDAVHVVFKASSLSIYHFHDDILTFTLYGLGEPWVVDSGLYKYAYDDPLRKYATSRIAHNVVLIDDDTESVPRSVVPSAIVSSDADGSVTRVVCRYVLAGRIEHTRTLTYSRPHRLEIEDALRPLDGSPHRYRQIFHLDPSKSVEPIGDQFGVGSRSRGHRLLIRPLLPGTRPYLVTGVTEPRLQGWVSYHTGEAVPASVVGFETNGTDVVFRTLLELVPAGAAAP